MDVINSTLTSLKADKVFTLIGYVTVLILLIVLLLYVLKYLINVLVSIVNAPPKVIVDITDDEKANKINGKKKINMKTFYNAADEQKSVPLFDPSTLDYFGEIPVTSPSEVKSIVARAKVAQQQWKKSSFKTRQLLMRTMLRYITENAEQCARVAVRDSGKTLLDSMIGEVLVTCEKLVWLADYGEQYLLPEVRGTGRMMMMKKVHVEFIPFGVIGVIIPWNYPFHNVFNPVSAALFSGNAIVLKVSEYASWSISYYKRIIDACLDAVGAPRDLVQYVVGYRNAGEALVKSPIDKLIFIGSPGVGKSVAKTAADTLLPVVLELGGKDPFVVCDDVNVDSIVQTACRGVWQNMGQNCAGPERFFVYEKVHDEFCDKVVKVVNNMKTGVSLEDPTVDCGAICMGPRQMNHYQNLVNDAVKKGAKLLAGGYIPSKNNDPLTNGNFYPPTVLADVPETAIIAQEEIFGPIMCIFKVKGDSDDEAIRMANNCKFALSSCAFSGSFARAKKVASQLTAGMSAVNDLEGCTYMSQSLPFGGCKDSGYDRFAGPEGLRGLCMIRSVCEDLVPFIRNAIPPPMQYPSTGVGHKFANGLIKMFYSTSIFGVIGGLVDVITYSVFKKKA